MLASPKRSALISGSIHAAAIALVLLITSTQTPTIPVLTTRVAFDPGRYIPLITQRSKGGGGGGMHEDMPARKGVPPRAAPRQYVPPTVHLVNLNPRLAMEATIVAPEVNMPPVDMSQYGVPNGILNGGNGPGKKGGIGDGGDGGVGSRKGPGAGDGDGPGLTGRSGIVGTVVAPVLLSKVEPEYSEEARKAKLQGTVMLRIEVNERGQTQNIRVQQSLGLGLDDRAIEAVRRWRFRAGTVNGKPAVTSALVEVNFRLL